MQVKWLKRSHDANEIIVVFSGWAIGPDVFAHLKGDQDLLFVDDYRRLNSDLPDLSAYDRRSLVAWSFGIAAYGHWQAEQPGLFHRTVAINGSLTPVDRRLGIPPAVFERTVEGLSEESYQAFLGHCFGERQPYQPIDVTARQAELKAVRDRGPAPALTFDHVWISRNDRIFPAVNLTRSWQDRADHLHMLDAPHVPFSAWDNWNELWTERD